MRSRHSLPSTWLVGMFAALTVCAQAPPKEEAQPSPYTPYQHRAWYIYLIAQYTEWPKNAVPDDTAPFVLGILGEDPFRNDIDVIRNQPIKNRKLTIQQFWSVEDVRHCQALFISSSEKDRLAQILKAVENSAILTFSEIDGFVRQGGMVKFWLEPKTTTEGFLRFEINQTAIEKARLSISSRVLKLAKPETKPD